MIRFMINNFFSALITLLLVSIGLFLLIEIGSDNIAVKILGIFSTPEQRVSFNKQLGLDDPVWLRYSDWLIGNDFRVQRRINGQLKTIDNLKNKETEWWVDDGDGQLARWKMDEQRLIRLTRLPSGEIHASSDESAWITKEDGTASFWGVDVKNNAVKWVKGKNGGTWILSDAGMRMVEGGAQKYIPLRKGLLRGDPGKSLQYGRPVAKLIIPRIRNTAFLASVAFITVMPLAVFLGIIAGVNEGKFLDRLISITSLGAAATPEFVTGVFLILIFGIWLKILPAVALFTSSNAMFENPKIMILPVLTLAAVELGYVARMTRSSMVEVMSSAYIRTAIVKGVPFWKVVIRHAVRNALIVPITVIMLHVNWLIGGVVVVEVIFGYPGLGKFIFDAAIFGDFNAIEAAAMITVIIAIITRLLGDLIYVLLNPRIRYS